MELIAPADETIPRLDTWRLIKYNMQHKETTLFQQIQRGDGGRRERDLKVSEIRDRWG